MGHSEAIHSKLGWVPGQFIEGWGNTRALVNHALLGRILLDLAERHQGLIQLLTICTIDTSEGGPDFPAALQDHLERHRSSLHPEDRGLPEAMVQFLDQAPQEVVKSYHSWHADWHLWYRQRVREHIARSPGQVVELGDDDAEVTYLVDAAYMREWLKDPGFFFE